MKATAQSPPVTQPEKHGFLKKVAMFLLPKRLHKYLTPEVFVAWNLSSYVTLAQVFIVTKWKFVSGWVTSVLVPTATKLWDDLLNGLRVLSDLIASTT